MVERQLHTPYVYEENIINLINGKRMCNKAPFFFLFFFFEINERQNVERLKNDRLFILRYVYSLICTIVFFFLRDGGLMVIMMMMIIAIIMLVILIIFITVDK